MPAVNFNRMRDRLGAFDFPRLFIDELGWSQPASRQPLSLAVKESVFHLRHLAQLGGVVVLEVAAPDGKIPDAKVRAAVHKEFARQFHENLLIFVDADRTQS